MRGRMQLGFCVSLVLHYSSNSTSVATAMVTKGNR